MPNASAEWVAPLNVAMTRFGITTKERIAAFLAQVAYESRELTKLEEDLSYSPGRLMLVWPHRFTTNAIAQVYAHDSHLLANFVYANRLGNGDEFSGDGYRYHGRGPIQLTGADAYRSFGHAIGNPGVLLSPELLLRQDYGSLSAAWFFHSRGCNELADRGDFDGVTARINGPAKEGLAYRELYFKRATGVLT